MSTIFEKLKSCRSEFNEVSIGEISSIFTRSSDYYKQNQMVGPNEGAIIIAPPNIVNNHLCLDEVGWYSMEGYNARPRDQVKDGDILLCKFAAPDAPYKSALVEELPGPAITNVALFMIKNINCNPAYLQFVISSPEFQSKLKNAQTKTTIPTINASAILPIKILLPPAKLQDELVESLEKFRNDNDELIDLLKKEIEGREHNYNYCINKVLWNK